MFKFFKVLSTIYLILSLLEVANGGIPLSRYESLMKRESVDGGLYDSNDKVIIVTKESFKPLVLWRPYSVLMEFYNTYCGHCRRFAPMYKELASNLWPWRNFIKVMAVDCAVDENNDLCREYEVMSYPTLRYFNVNFQGGENAIGKKVGTQDIELIPSILATNAMLENATNPSWPVFAPLVDKTPSDFFEDLSKDIDHGVVIYETADNSSLAAEIILEYSRYPSLVIRRILDQNLAKKYKLDNGNKIVGLKFNGQIDLLPTKDDTFKSYKETLMKYINSENLLPSENEASSSPITINENLKSSQLEEILKEVQKNKHEVYQADLEQAIKYTIFHEIPKFSDITGERLLALQQFIKAVNSYNPLGMNGRKFLKQLHDYVMSHNQSIKGEDFEAKAKNLLDENSPIFSSNNYVGCSASKAGLRGFTCSLWHLFHFMTVQDAENEKTTDPLAILQAMHSYVKNFFGCSDCANHFQAMASQRKIWGSTTKDNTILWLWSAHNEVNTRLAGDETEDPQFPKIQFPKTDSCKECYREPMHLPINNEINWDRTEVLKFMKNIYHPENINRYGVENDSLLRPTLAKLRQKRLLQNIFSDLDMKMGLMLYGFCVVMMIVAVKLFVHRGYRKKSYNNDYISKV